VDRRNARGLGHPPWLHMPSGHRKRGPDDQPAAGPSPVIGTQRTRSGSSGRGRLAVHGGAELGSQPVQLLG
jgi:hypothetical protein